MKEVFFTAAIMGLGLFVLGGILYLFVRGLYAVIRDWQLNRELETLRRESIERRKNSPKQVPASQSLSDLTATEQTIASDEQNAPRETLTFDLPPGLSFEQPVSAQDENDPTRVTDLKGSEAGPLNFDVSPPQTDGKTEHEITPLEKEPSDDLRGSENEAASGHLRDVGNDPHADGG